MCNSATLEGRGQVLRTFPAADGRVGFPTLLLNLWPRIRAQSSSKDCSNTALPGLRLDPNEGLRRNGRTHFRSDAARDPAASVFLREVIGVIPAVRVNVRQGEAVIAEDAAVAFRAVGEIPKRHTVHLAFFGVQAVDVSGGKEERCAAF